MDTDRQTRQTHRGELSQASWAMTHVSHDVVRGFLLAVHRALYEVLDGAAERCVVVLGQSAKAK